jgi:hypothetical protein
MFSEHCGGLNLLPVLQRSDLQKLTTTNDKDSVSNPFVYTVTDSYYNGRYVICGCKGICQVTENGKDTDSMLTGFGYACIFYREDSEEFHHLGCSLLFLGPLPDLNLEMFDVIRQFASLDHDGSLQGPPSLSSEQYFEGASLATWSEASCMDDQCACC